MSLVYIILTITGIL